MSQLKEPSMMMVWLRISTNVLNLTVGDEYYIYIEFFYGKRYKTPERARCAVKPLVPWDELITPTPICVKNDDGVYVIKDKNNYWSYECNKWYREDKAFPIHNLYEFSNWDKTATI